MHKFEAMHYDMDGVLADTEALHVTAELQTCSDYDFAVDPTSWGGFKGQRVEAISAYLIEHYGDPTRHDIESFISHKTEVFLGLAETQLKPIDGALEFLEWSRQHYRKLTLATSSNKRVQQFITRALGITEYFDAVTTGDDVTFGKPHPEPYLRAVRLAGVAAEQSVVIEDSKSGIASGLAAGCAVLAVTTSHSKAELASSRPTFIAETYIEARSLLQ